MDAWAQIERAARDRRSGSLEITARAASGMAALSTRRERLRATRILLRAHPAMAAVSRMCSVALDGGDVAAFVERVAGEAAAAADAARWLVGRRAAHVVTHSASSTVAAALDRARSRVARVTCTVSLPGGEGRPFARRLEREGFAVEVVPDASMAAACATATIAFVGADAVTDAGIVNKTGTRLLALAARDAGIPVYAFGASSKMLPAPLVARAAGETFELVPLEHFDGVVTERGVLRPAAIRRGVGRVDIPAEIRRLLL